MFKGQGQTTLLSSVFGPLNIFWPPLDQYQTWCRGYPQWVDDPYWFSRSHVQKSRSNYSSEPSVLSTILIPCLLALDRFCFYREDKPEFCTMGGIYVSETFLVHSCILRKGNSNPANCWVWKPWGGREGTSSRFGVAVPSCCHQKHRHQISLLVFMWRDFLSKKEITIHGLGFRKIIPVF